jgi:hypothetical protein
MAIRESRVASAAVGTLASRLPVVFPYCGVDVKVSGGVGLPPVGLFGGALLELPLQELFHIEEYME